MENKTDELKPAMKKLSKKELKEKKGGGFWADVLAAFGGANAGGPRNRPAGR
ncbi:MAG: hypothetical protein ACJ76H_01810 [Bacteriovoracaceae bacterium]